MREIHPSSTPSWGKSLESTVSRFRGWLNGRTFMDPGIMHFYWKVYQGHAVFLLFQIRNTAPILYPIRTLLTLHSQQPIAFKQWSDLPSFLKSPIFQLNKGFTPPTPPAGRVDGGLSRMRGNSHVRFLEGGEPARVRPYPTSFIILQL